MIFENIYVQGFSLFTIGAVVIFVGWRLYLLLCAGFDALLERIFPDGDGRAEPLGPEALRARPEPALFGRIGVTLAGAGLFGLGFYVLVPEAAADDPHYVAMAALFSAVGLIALSCLHPGYAVAWNHVGLRGPRRLWMLPGGSNVADIAYRDIVFLQVSRAGTFECHAADGTTIRWTHFHAGWRDLLCAIERARPDLFG
jgi:hypothetical protein